MSLAEASIRSRIVPLFVQHVATHVSEPAAAALARRHGIVVEDVAPGDRIAIVTLRGLAEVCDDASRVMNDPFGGLHVGASLERGAYGLVEYVFRSAPKVRDAIDQLVRLVPLINEAQPFAYFETEKTVIVEARVLGSANGLGRHANEFVLANFMRVARDMGGNACRVHRVWLAHEAPSDIGELVRFFGTDRLRFGAGFSGVELDREILDLDVRGADVALYTLLEEQARMACGARRRDDLAPVRECVRVALEHGDPAIETVARAMHVAPRTLQRRLSECGTTFRKVVDDVRVTLARVYLEEEARPLTEVAYRLGYSDLRAFVRAHKRWTGVTPGATRRDALAP